MLPHMPATMKDIARDLGVSVVTVSKVLRNQGRISAATRRKVLRRARQLKYQINWVARSLVTRRTYTIGLVLPDFMHSFFAEIAKAVSRTVREHGYHVIIADSEEDARLEVREIDLLLARQVDGLIIASSQPSAWRHSVWKHQQKTSNGQEVFRRIRDRGVPLVLIDRPVVRMTAPFIGADDVAIGAVATEHLIAQGCRHIAHLHGLPIGTAVGRREGYRRALSRHRLRIPAGYIQHGGYADTSGYRAMRHLLRLRPRPDGVVCFNDPVAVGAMKAILDAGLRVPQDVALVGAGNTHNSDLLKVSLSTVDQRSSEIGNRAAELLVQQMNGQSTKRTTKVLLRPRLIVRQSSKRS